jgi:hypothetical protein
MRAWGTATAAILGVVLAGTSTQIALQRAPAQPAPTQEEEPARRLLFSSGISTELGANWVERQQLPLPPSEKLAPFSPPVKFLEFVAFEDSRTNSALRIATTTNPFLGQNEVTLDAQMHGAANSGQNFIEYLFYFFFPPPGDCVEGASAAYERAVKDASGEDQRTRDLTIYSECKPSPLLEDFYSWQLSPGVLFQSTDGVKGARGNYPKFYVPPMEKLEANGLTFFIFEALGQTQLDLRAVNHFNLPDDLQGAQTDYFWAVGAPSPFPFLKDAQRKNVLIIQVAYAAIGLGPNERHNFRRLLKQMHAP